MRKYFDIFMLFSFKAKVRVVFWMVVLTIFFILLVRCWNPYLNIAVNFPGATISYLYLFEYFNRGIFEYVEGRWPDSSETWNW